MSNRLKQRLERGLQVFRSRSSETNSLEEQNKEQTVIRQASLQSETSTSADEELERANRKRVEKGENDGKKSWRKKRARRQLNAINSLAAIKLKMFFFAVALASCWLGQFAVQAGFFTFYFPNVLKPKGFGELTDMIESLDVQMNETRDTFADTQYFWGQLQKLDSVPSEYPEESACTDVFVQFRELAIAYTYADYEHFIKPFELFKEYLIEKRAEWYPAGLESKAALPREWEQNLYEKELQLKIDWMEKLLETESFKKQREILRGIWMNVRRGLDTSVACIYLRYAYRQISEDINEVALEANLESMREAMKVLRNAYKRIEHFKKSDKKVIEDIEEELKMVQRFTIDSS